MDSRQARALSELFLDSLTGSSRRLLNRAGYDHVTSGWPRQISRRQGVIGTVPWVWGGMECALHTLFHAV